MQDYDDLEPGYSISGLDVTEDTCRIHKYIKYCNKTSKVAFPTNLCSLYDYLCHNKQKINWSYEKFLNEVAVIALVDKKLGYNGDIYKLVVSTFNSKGEI